MTIRAFKELINTHRASIIFLMETKNNFEKLRKLCKYGFAFYVDPIGRSGGVALWWNSFIKLDVVCFSSNVTHTQLKDSSARLSYAMTFVYGCPQNEGKLAVWNKLREIYNTELLPWVCIGDFNDIVEGSEKEGGATPSPARVLNFKEMINDCELMDLEFKGPRFTRKGTSSNGELIRERLDRALVPNALVCHEIAIESDQSRILLHSEFSQRGRPYDFTFEAMWATVEECGDIIQKY